MVTSNLGLSFFTHTLSLSKSKDIRAWYIGKQNIDLYRDDSLSCFENISGPDSEKIKQKLFKIFKSNGLSITVECNLIVTDFLDVTFDLKSATYYPFRKPTMNYCISINTPTTRHQ